MRANSILPGYDNLYDNQLVDDLYTDVSAYKDGAHRATTHKDYDYDTANILLCAPSLYALTILRMASTRYIILPLRLHRHPHGAPQVSPEVSPDGSRLP